MPGVAESYTSGYAGGAVNAFSSPPIGTISNDPVLVETTQQWVPWSAAPAGPSSRIIGIDVQSYDNNPITGINVRYSDGTSTYVGPTDRRWLNGTTQSDMQVATITLNDGEFFVNASGTVQPLLSAQVLLPPLDMTTNQGRTLSGGPVNVNPDPSTTPWSVAGPSPSFVLYSLHGFSYSLTWVGSPTIVFLSGVVMTWVGPTPATTVTCSAPTGWPRDGFNLTLVASSVWACPAQITTIVSRPNTATTVRGPDTTSVCSDAAVLSVTYTVNNTNSSTAVVVSAAATNSVTCSAQPNVTGAWGGMCRRCMSGRGGDSPRAYARPSPTFAKWLLTGVGSSSLCIHDFCMLHCSVGTHQSCS